MNYFSVSYVITEECKISVTDTTTYPVSVTGGTFPESYYAKLLYWTRRLDHLTPHWDVSTPSADNWLLTPTVNDIYDVILFYIQNYSQMSFVLNGDVVFYSGNIYLYTCALPHDVSIGTTPDVNTCFVVVTDINTIYSSNMNVNAYWACRPLTVNCVEESPIVPCPDCPDCPECPDCNQTDEGVLEIHSEISKVSCNSWTVCSIDEVNTLTVKLYSIRDLSTVIEEYTLAPEECQDIEVDDDGVFIIRVYNGEELTETFLEYSFCNLETCFVSLTKELFCNEFDPCCTSCDAEAKRLMQIKRDHLNMMIAYISKIHYLLNENSVYCMLSGIINPESDDIETLISTNSNEIVSILNRLKHLTDRCGECYGTQTNETTGCTNCNQ
jgi:hypothetical protein